MRAQTVASPLSAPGADLRWGRPVPGKLLHGHQIRLPHKSQRWLHRCSSEAMLSTAGPGSRTTLVPAAPERTPSTPLKGRLRGLGHTARSKGERRRLLPPRSPLVMRSIGAGVPHERPAMLNLSWSAHACGTEAQEGSSNRNDSARGRRSTDALPWAGIAFWP